LMHFKCGGRKQELCGMQRHRCEEQERGDESRPAIADVDKETISEYQISKLDARNNAEMRGRHSRFLVAVTGVVQAVSCPYLGPKLARKYLFQGHR
jgi:hypothetical protein